MKQFNITFTILTTCLIGSIALADIWEWTDEDGVKHYSNYDPPAHATIMMKTHELSFDAEAHKERLEAERLEAERLEAEDWTDRAGKARACRKRSYARRSAIGNGTKNCRGRQKVRGGSRTS